MHKTFTRNPLKSPARQRGALTMFSAVLILILLTEVVIYATHVGIFEQRKSSNDMRQKQAFHAAEAGIQHAKEFFLANALTLSYDASGGWLEPGAERWQLCPASPEPDHPCSGEVLMNVPAVYDNTYFYSPLNSSLQHPDDPNQLPLDTADLLGLADRDERVEVYALLCILDINRNKNPAYQPMVQGCKQDPKEAEHIYFMLTLMARGQADCQNVNDPDSCSAEALVVERVGSFGPAAGDGGPGVPLTTRSNFPPGGTAEIVPNPNGGGIGVPISSWINGRQAGSLCPQQEDPVDPDGASWSTCEPHEWYGVPSMPDEYSPNGPYACPESKCECGPNERKITYSDNGEQVIGMDIVVDPLFPCDLFKAITGKDGTEENFWKMAGSIGTLLDDCSGLGPESSGVYWVVGKDCTLNANVQIGTPEFPVFLISAADVTKMSGGGSLFGVVLITDVLGNNATLDSTGGWTTYGAVVVDGELGHYSGTFQIVYIDAIVRLATQQGGLGEVAGGWTDAPPYWRFEDKDEGA
jgi:hypothetical protein